MVWDYGGCLDYREEGEDTHCLFSSPKASTTLELSSSLEE